MSTEDPTVAEMLTGVNAAILALLTRRVKSYTVEGTTYTYADLADLRLMRRDLQAESTRDAYHFPPEW